MVLKICLPRSVLAVDNKKTSIFSNIDFEVLINKEVVNN